MSIEDRLDRETAPGWKPEVGDQVIGTIVEISERPGTEYGPYQVITIEQADGTEVAVHAFHGVLKNELESKQPTEGDRIGIRYLGKKQGATREYENYRVVLERATPRATSTPVTVAAPSPAAAEDDAFFGEEPF